MRLIVSPKLEKNRNILSRNYFPIRPSQKSVISEKVEINSSGSIRQNVDKITEIEHEKSILANFETRASHDL